MTAVRRYVRSIGYRGLVLLMLGLIWIGLGQDVLTGGDPARWAELPMFRWVSADARGWVWIVTGLVAVAVALSRWARDGVGFVALYAMPAWRFLAFLWSWLDTYLPMGGPDYPGGLKWALIHLAIMAVIVICSRWPDPRVGDAL